MSTKPRILLLDEPCLKAKEIMREVADLEYDFALSLNNFQPDGCIGAFVGLSKVPYTQPWWKFIACPCTGTDHIKNIHNAKIIYLDDKWKANEGREVTSTAEHTWSLILQLAKMNRMQLAGKKLGIIGLGRIGQQIVGYANAFRMGVINCYSSLNTTEQLKPILELSDIITLHVPLNDETRRMIGEKEFAMMKPGTLLVNTSRAEIVNETALVNWLQTKGAGNGYADDFASRPIFCPNAIQTDHIGGNCLEAREATDCYVARKVVEYVKNNC